MKRTEIPDIFYEQLLLDQLSTDKIEEFADGFSTEKIEDLRESNNDILSIYTPEKIAGAIRERLDAEAEEDTETKRIVPFKKQYRFITLAAAVLVLVFAGTLPFIMRNSSNRGAETGLENVRIKGLAPSLHIFLNSEGRIGLLQENAVVKENDLLQLSYIAAGKKYGTIFSIDGNGAVTLHFPKAANESVILESDGETPLKWSYKLDNAPRFEIFYFVTSDTDFSVNDVLYYAYAIADSIKSNQPEQLDLPEGYDLYSIILNKEDK